MKTKIIIIVAIFLVGNLLFAQKPDWVQKTPIDKINYIGIGFCEKKVDNSHLQTAKEIALKNLANDISVSISNESFLSSLESKNEFSQIYKDEIRTSTKADIEGYELIDTWEDENSYWVYFALNKERYNSLKAEKIKKANSIALDFLEKAKQEETENNIYLSLNLYIQTLISLEKYLNEPNKINFNGKEVFLSNESFTSLNTILSKLLIVPEKLHYIIGAYGSLEKTIEVTVNYNNIKQTQIPIIFKFGDEIYCTATDQNGNADYKPKLTKKNNANQIDIELDFNKLFNSENLSQIMKGLIKTLPIPKTNVTLETKSIPIIIESTESNLGNKLSTFYVEPILKEELSKSGFEFVEKKDAKYLIKINAASRQGSVTFEMFNSLGDIIISVIEIKTNAEIFKTSVNSIKGLDLDYEKAGIKALINAGQKIKTNFISELIDKIK